MCDGSWSAEPPREVRGDLPRRAVEQAVGATGDLLAVQLDVTDPDSIQAAVQAAVAGVATQLRLYDLTRRRTVAVADGVGLVLCRGDVLWWSTGGRTVTAWQTLDLRTLT
ncbi:hypothetical protein V6U90_31175 [Micromonospora sp. CPCC 206060]|uniref:hypothetical protein n=1 Tax=Micromonospora sp. CPCC 206060 TaxID=3122406 RepID=UPI002FF1927F